MPRELSYQRLMDITGKLPPDEQEYVLAFVTANSHKARAKVEELEQEKREYRRMRAELARKDVPPPTPQEEKLLAQIEGLKGNLAGLQATRGRWLDSLWELSRRVCRVLDRPELLADPEVKRALVAAADGIQDTLREVRENARGGQEAA